MKLSTTGASAFSTKEEVFKAKVGLLFKVHNIYE